jgi:hypothetical protein
VNGDPVRLQQVLTNLLANAIKFTPQRGRIDVHLEQKDSHVQLEIKDSGIGLAAEDLQHVFERFWQAGDKANRKGDGLGLGLAIARDLVQLHGGSIRAESAGKGQGTTFVVELPVLDHDESALVSAGEHRAD